MWLLVAQRYSFLTARHFTLQASLWSNSIIVFVFGSLSSSFVFHQFLLYNLLNAFFWTTLLFCSGSLFFCILSDFFFFFGFKIRIVFIRLYKPVVKAFFNFTFKTVGRDKITNLWIINILIFFNVGYLLSFVKHWWKKPIVNIIPTIVAKIYII